MISKTVLQERTFPNMPNETFMQALQVDIQAKAHAAARIFARTHADLNNPLFDSTELSPLNHIREDLLSFADNPVALETLQRFREEIIKAIQGYYRLARYFGVAYEWVFHNSMLYKAHHTKGGSIAPVAFYNIHLEFLLKMKEDNGADIETLIDEFVPCIPLRMTGAAYADYLRSSLNAVFDVAGMNAIGDFLQDRENLQLLITPGSHGVPECCATLKQEIDDIWQKDFVDQDSSDSVEYLEKFAPIEQRVQDYLGMIFTLLDGIDSAFIVLEYGSEDDMEEIRSWLGKSMDEIDRAVLESVEALSKSVFDEDVDVNELDFNNPTIQAWSALTSLFNETGMDYFHLPDRDAYDNVLDLLDDKGKKDAVKDLIKQAIEQAEKCVVGLSSRRKRFLRQYIMRGLIFPAKGDTLKEYQKYFVDTYTTLDEFNKMVMINRAEYFQMLVAERYK